MKKLFFSKLSIKLISLISIVIIALLSIQTIFTASRLKSDLVNELAQNTYSLSELIKNSTRYSMKLNLRNDVHEIVKNLGKQKGMETIRIYNKKGTIKYSIDFNEISTTIDTRSKTCNPCHVHAIPLGQLSINDRVSFEEDEEGNRSLILLNPIENGPDCYTAECHAHHADEKLLGILEVMVSMQEIKDIIDRNVANVITNSIIETLLIAFLIGLLITFMINKPLNIISEGMKELAEGNLQYKISIKSQDELGEVANQFNNMSSKLDEAYKEIKAWNVTLNKRIDEKTEELKAIYNQVIQIERLASLGKLSATVAHELNNPLEGILTYSKLIAKKLREMERDNEFEKLLNFLDLIAEESARSGKIVKDLLLFSNRHDEELVEENLLKTIDKSIALINHHLEINNIKLIKDIEDKNLKVLCNPANIEEAMVSLLMNAIESMGSEGKIIVQILRKNNNAVVKIIDEGIGISDQDLPHIFEPFYTTKSAGKGTGLGLAVAYGIIQRHKGKIEVEKTSTKGTTFKVSIPLNKSNEQKK